MVVWCDDLNEVEKHWGYGYVWKGKERLGKLENYVNEKTINYIVKYVTKKNFKHKLYKPIILTSSGIGRNYTNTHNFKEHRYKPNETKESYTSKTGHKTGLPIYYRNKAFTEEEREKLWIEKLDKNIRWVCGEKIDISKTDKNYYKILKHYQELNMELG